MAKRAWLDLWKHRRKEQDVLFFSPVFPSGFAVFIVHYSDTVSVFLRLYYTLHYLTASVHQIQWFACWSSLPWALLQFVCGKLTVVLAESLIPYVKCLLYAWYVHCTCIWLYTSIFLFL